MNLEIFFSVAAAMLCVFRIRDEMRSDSRELDELRKKDEELAKDHNRLMNVAHDQGRMEEAEMHAKYYVNYTKSARRLGRFSKLLWPI